MGSTLAYLRSRRRNTFSRILLDAGQGIPAYITELKGAMSKSRVSLQAILITHWHPDHIFGIKDVLKLVAQREYRRSSISLATHAILPAELPVYKRKLLELPDVTKLRAYGMPENPDTVADFKFINNGTEQFTIETEGARLK